MKTRVNENICVGHLIRTYSNRRKSTGAIKRQSWMYKVNSDPADLATADVTISADWCLGDIGFIDSCIVFLGKWKSASFSWGTHYRHFGDV